MRRWRGVSADGTRRPAGCRIGGWRARAEVEACGDFDYVVVNEDVEQTVAALGCVVRAERLRTARCTDEIRRIVETFPLSQGATHEE